MKIASAISALIFIACVSCQNSNPRWNDPMQSANDECISEVRKSVLERHNYYRSLHGLQPFQTDPQLEKSAQDYAQSQANAKKLIYSIDWPHKNTTNENQYIRNLGNPFLPQNFITLKFCSRNNIFFFFVELNRIIKTFCFLEFGYECVDAWYNEINFLNFTKLKWSLNVDNVFRLLWKNSTKLGTGAAFGSNNMFCIVQYSPVADKWRLKGNVLPPIKKTATPSNVNLTKFHEHWNDKLNIINDDCIYLYRKRLLERHNHYRSLHGLPPMTADPALENITQEYAVYQAKQKNLLFEKNKNSENNDNIILGCAALGHTITLRACYGKNIFFLCFIYCLLIHFYFLRTGHILCR